MGTNRNSREPTKIYKSSGNVFADIGLPQPEEALAKVQLAEAIDSTITRRRLSQGEAAAMMGVDQPTVSRLMNGRVDGFSQERLMRYLTALGDEVEIIVRHPNRYNGTGRITISIE